jgi:hypothetical protein
MSRELASYAAAVLSLCLQALAHGIALPLRGVECVLCEDGLRVSLFISDGAQGWLFASFELDQKTNEDAFDPSQYIEAFGAREPV